MNYSIDEISIIQHANKVADLPPKIAEAKHLGALTEIEIPAPNKSAVLTEELNHRKFTGGEFWKHIPDYKDISSDVFLDGRIKTQYIRLVRCRNFSGILLPLNLSRML